MTAADMIQLKDVVASCTQFMKSELHPSNAVGIYRSFEYISIDGLDFSKRALSMTDFLMCTTAES
jgi:hypothetical protein